MRPVSAIVAGLASLAALLPATARAADAVSARVLAALADAPCPPYLRVFDPTPADRRAPARRGRFYVLNRSVELKPPVNWRQDPYRSHNWRQSLHAWDWIDPLIAPGGPAHSARLRRARDLALDWIEHNPPSTWREKATADRAGRLAYLARAAACRELLTPAQARRLTRTAEQHGRYLADPVNHRSEGNQSAYVDAGLMLVAGQLPFLPNAGAWQPLARDRFLTQMREQVHPVEGVNLEHSPSYQFSVLRLVSAVVGFPGNAHPELVAIRDRMRAVAPWFVMPDGQLTRLGDTPSRLAPGWARGRARALRGFAPTRAAGFGIVRQGGSYLAVSAGLWDRPHAHADQLGFEWWDRGRPIITDAGRFGFRRSEATAARQAFTKSAPAHSTLTVDGSPFTVRDEFGTGITGTGEGGGWYALEATNPLLERQQGVDHRRLFLYRPGRALVLVDRTAARVSRRLRRHLQFDAAFQERATGPREVALGAPGLTVYVTDAPVAGEAIDVVEGRERPLLGWTNSPDRFETFRKRPTVVLRSRGRSLTHAAALGLGGRARARILPGSTDAVTRLSVTLPGEPARTVSVSRSGETLTLVLAAQPTRE